MREAEKEDIKEDDNGRTEAGRGSLGKRIAAAICTTAASRPERLSV